MTVHYLPLPKPPLPPCSSGCWALAHNHGSRINVLMRQGMVTEHNARYPQKYPHHEHATEHGQRDAATVAMRSAPSMYTHRVQVFGMPGQGRR
jgi:hypothetical protein